MGIVFPSDLMVSVSGFRGVVGDPLTPELVGGLSAAYGAFLRAEGAGSTVYVGRDSRTSGPMLARAAIAGLQSVGCRVVDVGVVPTPTLMLAVEDSDAAGGIGITASHNPAEWNAMKFAAGEGVFLDGERMARFQEYVQTEDPPRVRWDELGRVTRDPGAVSRHLARILELDMVDVNALRQRSFRVALDCVNGAGGPIMTELLNELGCRVEAIGLEPHGRFHRDPEPTAANLKSLAELVRDTGADIGLAVDPDVDRLSLVDETGSPMGEDLTLALAADVVLRRTAGTVVTNLSTSQVLEDVAASHGASVVRSPVGEINVARRMQDVHAVIGGEGNGGGHPAGRASHPRRTARGGPDPPAFARPGGQSFGGGGTLAVLFDREGEGAVPAREARRRLCGPLEPVRGRVHGQGRRTQAHLVGTAGVASRPALRHGAGGETHCGSLGRGGGAGFGRREPRGPGRGGLSHVWNRWIRGSG